MSKVKQSPYIHLISSQQLAKFWFTTVFVITVMNLLALLAVHIGDYRYAYWVKWFNVDRERNIPALFSAVSLLCCAALLSIIGKIEHARQHPWLGWKILALTFIFLAVDESISLHEGLITPARELFDQPNLRYGLAGLFYYAWMIPYLMLMTLAFFFFIPFFRRLDATTLRWFALAAGLYLTGAVGFEMLGGRYIYIHGHGELYRIIYSLEELFEMLGFSVFIVGLAKYIEGPLGGLVVRTEPVNHDASKAEKEQ